MTIETLEEYPLELVQGKTYRRRFAWRQPDASYANLHDWNLYSQVRTKDNPAVAELLLDLGQYLSVADSTGTDGKYVHLVIPGSATAGLTEVSSFAKGAARWDIFAVSKTDLTIDELVVQGPATLDLSATDMSAPGLES